MQQPEDNSIYSAKNYQKRKAELNNRILNKPYAGGNNFTIELGCDSNVVTTLLFRHAQMKFIKEPEPGWRMSETTQVWILTKN